jgi:hypothetical protein
MRLGQIGDESVLGQGEAMARWMANDREVNADDEGRVDGVDERNSWR